MREVKSQDWAALCDRINRNERGGTITVHKVQPGGTTSELARDVTFGEIEFGRRDGCNDHLSIRLSDGAERNHEIVEPIHIRLMESEDGVAFQSVVVAAEDGVTILTFHPAIRPAWLSGLKLR